MQKYWNIVLKNKKSACLVCNFSYKFPVTGSFFETPHLYYLFGHVCNLFFKTPAIFCSNFSPQTLLRAVMVIYVHWLSERLSVGALSLFVCSLLWGVSAIILTTFQRDLHCLQHPKQKQTEKKVAYCIKNLFFLSYFPVVASFWLHNQCIIPKMH